MSYLKTGCQYFQQDFATQGAGAQNYIISASGKLVNEHLGRDRTNSNHYISPEQQNKQTGEALALAE